MAFRKEFGHCEIDTVIEKKNEGEPCVLTLVEYMTRMGILVKARNHTAEAITEAIEQIMSVLCRAKRSGIQDRHWRQRIRVYRPVLVGGRQTEGVRYPSVFLLVERYQRVL